MDKATLLEALKNPEVVAGCLVDRREQVDAKPMPVHMVLAQGEAHSSREAVTARRSDGYNKYQGRFRPHGDTAVMTTELPVGYVLNGVHVEYNDSETKSVEPVFAFPSHTFPPGSERRKNKEQHHEEIVKMLNAYPLAEKLAEALESVTNIVALGAPKYDPWESLDPSIMAVDAAREALADWNDRK